MTVVVALKKDDELWIGSDGESSSDYTHISSTERKFQELFPGFWIGIAGLSSMKLLMRSGFEVPKYDGENLEKYLLKSFIPKLKDFMKENEYLITNEDEPSTMECEMLICCENNIYYLSNDFDLSLITNDYIAIGTGKLYAMASLYENRPSLAINTDMSPEARLIKSIDNAKHFDMACGGEIYLKRIDF